MLEDSSPTPDRNIPIVDVTVEPATVSVEPPVINIPADGTNHAATANKYSFVGLILNALLFLCTLTALYFTRDSLKLSEKAMQYASYNDSITGIKTRIKDSITEMRNRRSDSIILEQLNLAKNSLKEQIRSLKQSQDRFTKENEPFIEIDNLTISPAPSIGKNFYINYTLISLKNSPIQLLSEETISGLSRTDSGFIKQMTKFPIKYFPFKKYLIKEITIERGAANSLTDFQMTAFINDKDVYLYYYKAIKYKDLITGNIRIFKCFAKLKYLFGETKTENHTYSEFIVIENHKLNSSVQKIR